MKKIFLSLIAIAVSAVSFAQNFPFPMNENGYSYPNGIVPTNVSNTKIQSKFESWENALWAESGKMGRIKYDSQSYTVSEGIGYGMLIYVYMANSTNTQCQDHFDKLYTYYKNFSDNGLMHWKINGFSSVSGSGAATDGDLDVALALCLAAKQWGKSSNYTYATEAETLLKNIYQQEVTTKNGLKVFKPGNKWDNYGNPCYFTIASVGVFDQAQTDLGFTTTKDWATVYTDCHTYLEKTQRGGVWPNWAKWDGSLGTGNDGDADHFGWDACRCPWRVAWDYLWFGNSSSLGMLKKTLALLDTKGWLNSPNSVGFMTGLSQNSYSSISTTQYAGNVAWTGSVACALMTDSKYQSNLDTWNKQQNNNTGSPYYAETLQLLYMLTLSGNAANFFDADSDTPVTPTVNAAETDGSTLTLTCSTKMASSTSYSNFTIYKNGTAQSNVISSMSVSGKTITLNLKNIEIESSDIISISYNGTTLKSEKGVALGSIVKMSVNNKVSGGTSIIADCEDVVTLTGGAWYTYNDSGDGGKSTVTPTAGDDFVMTAGGANGTAYAAKMTGSLNKGTLSYDPFVGFGFNMTDDESAYDCTGATSISFYHKGDAVVLSAKTSDVKNSNYYACEIAQHSNWTLVTLTWDDFAQANWGDNTQPVDFNLAHITGFQWQYQQSTGSSCTVWIDEVTIEGITIEGVDDDDVNRSKLAATLATANTLLSGASTATYPQSAITTFSNAIESAATVHDTPTSTQDEIDAANTALTKAIATFKATGFDNSTLLATIATAEKLSKSATTTQYPQSAINALNSAISTAKSASSATSQTTLDNANTTLLAAIETFKASEIVAEEKETLLTGAEEATTITGGAWYTYDDSADGGKSTVTPTVGKDFVMTAGGANGTAYAAKMTGSLNKGGLSYDPFVGFGFNMTDDEKAYDCTGATGIKFYHKGDAVVLSAKTSDVKNSNYYACSIDQHSNWTLVTLTWDDFSQADWGTSTQPVDFNLAHITGFQWQYQQSSGSSCQVWIDEVTLKGIEIESPETPEDPVDKTELASLISLSNTILNTTTAGTAVGQYSSAKRSALSSALSSAKTVNSNASATQSAVDAQVTALQNAYDAYIASKVTEDPSVPEGPVNKDDLAYLITSSENALNTTVGGTAVGQYSQVKRAALINALNSAKPVNMDEGATQSEVDAVTKELKTAYNEYMQSKVTGTAVDDVDFVLNVYPNPCVNFVTIESSEVIKTIKAIGMNGSQSTYNVDQESVELDVTNLKNGTFVLFIEFVDGSVKTTKVVKY